MRLVIWPIFIKYPFMAEMERGENKIVNRYLGISNIRVRGEVRGGDGESRV